jgi:hypothetical protein
MNAFWACCEGCRLPSIAYYVQAWASYVGGGTPVLMRQLPQGADSQGECRIWTLDGAAMGSKPFKTTREQGRLAPLKFEHAVLRTGQLQPMVDWYTAVLQAEVSFGKAGAVTARAVDVRRLVAFQHLTSSVGNRKIWILRNNAYAAPRNQNYRFR